MSAAPKQTVVVIEDDEAIVQMYRLKLEKAGFNVQTAGDGDTGLALIQSAKPDIVLLDLMMPNKTGVELLEELRHQPNGASVKVMVLTNVEDDAVTSQIYRLAPIDYIIKSNMTPQEVLERVQKALKADPHERLAQAT